MKQLSDNTYLIGQLNSAEMELAVIPSNSVCVSKPKKFCINIHHINEHWVTLTYNVYDSLTSGDRIKQIKQQLLILYGVSPNVR